MNNYGNAWTTSEESDLIRRFNDGKSIPQLAELHQRSVGGILSRLAQLCLIVDIPSLRAYYRVLPEPVITYDQIKECRKINHNPTNEDKPNAKV